MFDSECINNLIKNGFCKLNTSVYDESQIKDLKRVVEIILAQPTISNAAYRKIRRSSIWHPLVFWDEKALVGSNIACVNDEFDNYLEQLITSPIIMRYLDAALGADYKIWNIGIRRAPPGDRGLGLHQDTAGEMTMTILLDSNPTMGGSTVFLPGTHWRGLTIREIFLYPLLPIWLFNRKKLRYAAGDPGDIFLFYNRVWHGRFRRKELTPVTAILISFIPSGSKYPIHSLTSEQELKLPPELLKRLSANVGVAIDSTGIAEVLNSATLSKRDPRIDKILSGKFEKSFFTTLWSFFTLNLTILIIHIRRILLG